MKSISLKTIRYLLIAPFLIYPVVYFIVFDWYGSGYLLINNIDRIVNMLWFLFGVMALIIHVSLFRLKRTGAVNTSQLVLYSVVTVGLLLSFRLYAFLISFIDFVLNGF